MPPKLSQASPRAETARGGAADSRGRPGQRALPIEGKEYSDRLHRFLPNNRNARFRHRWTPQKYPNPSFSICAQTHAAVPFCSRYPSHFEPARKSPAYRGRPSGSPSFPRSPTPACECAGGKIDLPSCHSHLRRWGHEHQPGPDLLRQRQPQLEGQSPDRASARNVPINPQQQCPTQGQSGPPSPIGGGLSPPSAIGDNGSGTLSPTVTNR